jgi:amino acid transporter
MYWVIGFVISCAALAVYLELASYFPSRSGAEVVYLEQAYPRPKYFFPVAFAVQSVILSFSSSNAVGKFHPATYLTAVTLTRDQCSRHTFSAWPAAHQRIGSRRVSRLLATRQLLSVSSMHSQSYRSHTDRRGSGCHEQQTFPTILGRRWIRESRHTCLVSIPAFFAEGTFAHPKQH